MKTETEVNKYVRELRKKKLKKTAENLLHVMRPYVEDILTTHGRLQPSSQYNRAQRLLAEIRTKIVSEAKYRDQKDLCKQEDTLRHFMAVWKTVWILEGKPV